MPEQPRPAEPPIPEAMLKGWIALGKKLLWRADLRRRLEDNGLCLTPARFYNEIPTLKEIEDGFEAREAQPYDFDFLRRDALRDTLRQLQPFAAEFDPPEEAEKGFRWRNGMFGGADAMSYYCMLRWLRPRRVLEVGSGFSTMVAVAAAARNGDTTVSCIEPYPSPALLGLGVEVRQGFAQEFGAEFFNDHLADGDVLFIDSTHTVKPSSDCCHLYLRVLPRLRRRVVVHVHDIALPQGRPVRDAVERHIYWTEQHLLAAYLLDNPKVRFLFGAALAAHEARAELDALMGGKAPSGGGSFWFELDGRRAA